MRTTITLDPDVAAQLEQLRWTDDRSFKQVINDLLRLGLAHRDDSSSPGTGPYTRVVSLGKPLLADIDDVSEVLAIIEGENHR